MDNKLQRRTIRLKDYDYAQNGAYFLTFCVQQRECLFGEINDQGNMKLNDAGQMIEKWWKKLSDKFPEVEIDEYVIMPNHFHGILVIVGADPRVCPNEKEKGAHVGAPLQKPAVGDMVQDEKGAHVGAPLQKPAVGDMVQWFKTMTTNEYIRGVKERNWESFPGKLWQRNYY
jgi:REP element-mobilizing transposase RayT